MVVSDLLRESKQSEILLMARSSAADIPSNVVKRNTDLLKAQIVEGNHAYENCREWQALDGHVVLDLKARKHFKEGMEWSAERQHPAGHDGDKALEPGNKEWRVETKVRRRKEVLVQEDHRDGHHPIEGDDQPDTGGMRSEVMALH